MKSHMILIDTSQFIDPVQIFCSEWLRASFSISMKFSIPKFICTDTNFPSSEHYVSCLPIFS